jgi:hypothetical protein
LKIEASVNKNGSVDQQLQSLTIDELIECYIMSSEHYFHCQYIHTILGTDHVIVLGGELYFFS